MRKTLNITLILLIIFNSAGYVFTYWQLKVIFKKTALKKIEQSLTNDQLQLIVSTLDGKPAGASQCVRVNKKEFRLNNEMYDIVRSEFKDTLIYHYCMKDENENLLEAAFISYVEGNSSIPSGTIPVKNLLKSFASDWITISCNEFFFTEFEDHFITYLEATRPSHSRIPVPPPEFIIC